jgi:hypothetical protein
MSDFVLVETLASKAQKRTLYFARMTAIGPMTTTDPNEAMRFASEEAARRHPASFFALTCFEPRAVGGGREGAE